MWTTDYGGKGGHSFVFSDNSFSLIRVRGKCGAMVDQLQFTFVNIHTGIKHQSEAYGGEGGGYFDWQVPQGEWITTIYIMSGTMVDAIAFRTNTGRESEWFGGNGGIQHVISTNGKRIAGVAGRCGARIDSLSFLLV